MKQTTIKSVKDALLVLTNKRKKAMMKAIGLKDEMITRFMGTVTSDIYLATILGSEYLIEFNRKDEILKYVKLNTK